MKKEGKKRWLYWGTLLLKLRHEVNSYQEEGEKERKREGQGNIKDDN